MSTLAIIQARLGSTRLPRKALMDIGGKPLIQHVVERARQIAGVDRVIVTAPMKDGSEIACALDDEAVVFCPTGIDENDVLGRFAATAASYPDYDTIVRLTGDCACLDPLVSGAVLKLFQECHAWYAWNVYPGYTDGEDTEAFRREALMRAHREATSAEDREHVTPFLRRHYPVVTLKPWVVGKRKTSVDCQADLDYVRELYARDERAQNTR